MSVEPDSISATQLGRRDLLRFLLGSPLLLSSEALVAEQILCSILPGPASADETRHLIASAAEAMDVFDFEAVAERNLTSAHYKFLSMEIHDEFTLEANREAFAEFKLRPRRLIDVRDLDTSTEVFGTRLSCPILLAPAGGQKAFHPDGEVAVARAANRKDHVQILSTGSSASLDEVVAAREAPIWFQLYTPRLWVVTQRQLKHAERAGCPVVVLTVDAAGAMGPTNVDRIRDAHRAGRADDPVCQSCHSTRSNVEDALLGTSEWARTMGFDLVAAISDFMVLNWDYVDRIRDATSMKLVIKGILTREDARLCVEHGVDGLIVSNHGGRTEDSGLSTIEALPEIVEAVAGRIPILIDSGFRRGTDVFKALALGASAVCVGRPYLWGLSAFGQEGVEAVLAILRRELEIIMRQMGTPTLRDITTARIRGPSPSGAR